MIGIVEKGVHAVSAYQPPADVVSFTVGVRDDYGIGEEILSRPWTELNDRSVIEDENRGQMMLNAFVDLSNEDPEEAWKWRGTRSMARNKGIAMHAQLTANFLLPLFTAQNENDEVDLDFSEIMREVIEWMASPVNSNYQSSFLQMVFAMESNPVTFLGAEYCEVYQTVRERTKDGYTKKQIIDEVLSGFKAPIWSSSQVLITNAFERNIQKQRRIIKRRWVEKSELEAKYGEHANWGYIQEGIKSIYNDQDGLFYDIKDDEHLTLVAEETALDRRNDCEVTFLNGVYVGDADIEANPISHRDQNNAPKYNVIPFGFHRIGEHFFYYKSMMNSLGWDNMLYDAMSEVVMNNAFLEQDPPIAVTGSDQIDSSVNFPGGVFAFEDEKTKAFPIFPQKNFAAGFSALRETEKSITDGSVNDTLSGQEPAASQKAFNVASAQANAKKLIGAVGKSLAESVTQYGDLMKDIAINNITAPEVMELAGGNMRLKYASFVLENKQSGGRTVNKTIKFDQSLIGVEMTDAERDGYELDLLTESGYPQHKNSMRLVNPEMFAKFKYLCRTDVAEMFAKNEEYWQAVLGQLYAMLRADPLIHADKLLGKLMYSYFQSEGSEFVRKEPLMAPPGGTQGLAPAAGGGALSNMVDQKRLAGAAESALSAI